MDMPAPVSHEDKVDVLQLVPRERMTECTAEQFVRVPQFHDSKTVWQRARDIAGTALAREVGSLLPQTRVN